MCEVDTSAVFDALNEMSTRIPATASELGFAIGEALEALSEGLSAAFVVSVKAKADLEKAISALEMPADDLNEDEADNA